MPRELSAGEKAAFAANPAFEKAAERESKQLLKKPDTNELLDLYGSSPLPASERERRYRQTTR